MNILKFVFNTVFAYVFDNLKIDVFVFGHREINIFVLVLGKVYVTRSLQLSTHIPSFVVPESLQPLQRLPIRSGNVKLKPNTYIKGKRLFLYNAVSSPSDRSKCFLLHPLADLFIPTPARFSGKHSSNTAITVQILFSHSHTSATVYSHLYS